MYDSRSLTPIFVSMEAMLCVYLFLPDVCVSAGWMLCIPDQLVHMKLHSDIIYWPVVWNLFDFFLHGGQKDIFLKTAHKSCVTTYFSICLSHQDIIWLFKSCAHIIWTTVIMHLCLFWSLKASVNIHSLHSLIAWTKVGRTFFKIFSFVFRGKKVIPVLNDMRASK